MKSNSLPSIVAPPRSLQNKLDHPPACGRSTIGPVAPNSRMKYGLFADVHEGLKEDKQQILAAIAFAREQRLQRQQALPVRTRTGPSPVKLPTREEVQSHGSRTRVVAHTKGSPGIPEHEAVAQPAARGRRVRLDPSAAAAPLKSKNVGNGTFTGAMQLRVPAQVPAQVLAVVQDVAAKPTVGSKIGTGTGAAASDTNSNRANRKIHSILQPGMPDKGTSQPVMPADLIEQFRAEYRSDYQRLAQLEAQRDAKRAAEIEAEKAAYRAAAQSRTPAWWPREVRVNKSPPRRPPPAQLKAAADARLDEIRTKLQAGDRLSVDEQNDAEAILKLKARWSEDAALSERKRAAAANEVDAPILPPLIGHAGLKLPVIPRRRVEMYGVAECMVFESP